MICRVAICAIIICGFSVGSVSGQKTISLDNPSFEGSPHQGNQNPLTTIRLNQIQGSVNAFQPIPGWTDCGFKTETPPDLHGANTDFFGVNREPFDGGSFLGMVVRYNETWERVSQKLSSPLEAGKCYQISLHLARDTSYRSATRDSDRIEKSFAQPCVMRIKGGNGFCASHEMMAESVPIKNDDWRRYDFILKPKETWHYIELEAFYKTPVLFPYNGNILVDLASDIKEIPCPDTPIEPAAPRMPVIAKVETKKEHQPQPPAKIKKKPIVKNTPPEPKKEVAQIEETKEKLLKDLDVRTIKEGQVIQIEKLFFEADKADITFDSYDVLDEVYDFLSSNPKVTVEIAGHTNNRPPHHFCDSLSTARAVSVADYLVRRGIDDERIKAKGYGKRDPVATNRTIEGRKRNQRVEIKILSLDGEAG